MRKKVYATTPELYIQCVILHHDVQVLTHFDILLKKIYGEGKNLDVDET